MVQLPEQTKIQDVVYVAEGQLVLIQGEALAFLIAVKPTSGIQLCDYSVTIFTVGQSILFFNPNYMFRDGNTRSPGTNTE
jgi:hypothetical protein